VPRATTTKRRPALAVVTDRPAGAVYAEIGVEDLADHPRNVRRDVGDVTELAASIAEHGVLEPLVVAPYDADPNGAAYVVIAGHRRLAAARLAAVPTVPCVVRPTLAGDVDVILAMLVENLQRADLSPIEEATAYTQLELHGLTAADIAQRTGRARSTVEARLHLMDLPEPTRDRIHARALTLDQAAALAEFADDPQVFAELDAAAGTRDWPFTLKRAREWREEKARAAARCAELEAAGVRVVDMDDLSGGKRWDHHLGHVLGHGYGGVPRDVVEAHRDCPGHAALAPRGNTGDELLMWLCMEPHRHRPDGPSPDDREYSTGAGHDDAGDEAARAAREAEEQARREAEAEAARQLAEDCRAAAAVRGEWLRRFAGARGKVPARDAVAIARYVARLAAVVYLEADPTEWLAYLGVDADELTLDEVAAALVKAADQRDPHRVLLAMVAVESETTASRHVHWAAGRVTQDLLPWLDLLVVLGWTPSTWELDHMTAARALATPADDTTADTTATEEVL
jgi:ParB/RepB/Spo0J family partition protein